MILNNHSEEFFRSIPRKSSSESFLGRDLLKNPWGFLRIVSNNYSRELLTVVERYSQQLSRTLNDSQEALFEMILLNDCSQELFLRVLQNDTLISIIPEGYLECSFGMILGKWYSQELCGGIVCNRSWKLLLQIVIWNNCLEQLSEIIILKRYLKEWFGTALRKHCSKELFGRILCNISQKVSFWRIVCKSYSESFFAMYIPKDCPEESFRRILRKSSLEYLFGRALRKSS